MIQIPIQSCLLLPRCSGTPCQVNHFARVHASSPHPFSSPLPLPGNIYHYPPYKLLLPFQHACARPSAPVGLSACRRVCPPVHLTVWLERAAAEQPLDSLANSAHSLRKVVRGTGRKRLPRVSCFRLSSSGSVRESPDVVGPCPQNPLLPAPACSNIVKLLYSHFPLQPGDVGC